jgi:hypothetical protein
LAAAVMALLALTLSGCGEDAGGAGSGGSGGEATTPAETTSPTDPASTDSSTTDPAELTAEKVVYARSGGLTGDLLTFTFTAGEPPPDGFTAQQQQKILAAASSPELRELKTGELPKGLCCDLFIYEVTVTWSDGSSRAYATADGRDTPPALQRLMQVIG